MNEIRSDKDLKETSTENSNVFNILKHPDLSTAKEELLHILIFYLSKTPETAIKQDWLQAVTIYIRGITFYKLDKVKKFEKNTSPKFVNYLSMEFLLGRTLVKSIDALGMTEIISGILSEHDLTFAELEEIEPEPGLGNGGLGRLAACFMDSMAALEIPTFGYGIRYDYGMFTQKIINGQQIETPDIWLLNDYMWEIHRPEIKYLIPFSNLTSKDDTISSRKNRKVQVYASAYDVLIPCLGSKHISRIRLWSSYTTEGFVLELFNVGDYARAFNEKNNIENISSVLYPDDSSLEGKELRLKQGYFFSSASIQDILYRFTRNCNDFTELPNNQAIHLNDTHPALAIPEFIRVVTKNYHIPWDEAWEYCQKIFSYTNHTLLPEALEKWEVNLIDKLIPDILQIIYQINENFLNEIRIKNNHDNNFLSKISLIDEGWVKKVKMANLSIVSSHKINGVSKLHSRLMTESIFKEFHHLYPEKFTNVTNGITPRRWLKKANPLLTKLIDSKIGNNWVNDLKQIEQLKQYCDDENFQQEYMNIKLENKKRLANYLEKKHDIKINYNSLIDVQVKRIHEYKRQLLNMLSVINRYYKIIENPEANWVPRTVLISGKAASAYYMAKLIIRFINNVARVINNDERTNQLLKLHFIPDYTVSVAENVIPAADLSQQISTAGLEASGTGNMKFSINGALTIGTLDGANIEIMESVGEENFFLFGKTVEQIQQLKLNNYDPLALYEHNQDLRKVINEIRYGYFSPKNDKRYHDLVHNILHSDNFMVLADFESYVQTQNLVDETYKDKKLWAKKSILNFASMGKFSSDVSIEKYAKEIWNVK